MCIVCLYREIYINRYVSPCFSNLFDYDSFPLLIYYPSLQKLDICRDRPRTDRGFTLLLAVCLSESDLHFQSLGFLVCKMELWSGLK